MIPIAHHILIHPSSSFKHISSHFEFHFLYTTILPQNECVHTRVIGYRVSVNWTRFSDFFIFRWWSMPLKTDLSEDDDKYMNAPEWRGRDTFKYLRDSDDVWIMFYALLCLIHQNSKLSVCLFSLWDLWVPNVLLQYDLWLSISWLEWYMLSYSQYFVGLLFAY